MGGKGGDGGGGSGIDGEGSCNDVSGGWERAEVKKKR